MPIPARSDSLYRPSVCLGMLGALLALSPPPLPAQTAARDSANVHDEARQAQASFELRRRSMLPAGKGNGGKCDENFGGFCYWYEGHDAPLPEEPPAVNAARRDLLERLAEYAERLPGDDWIAGQRVRYLVEAGDPEEATRVAEACRTPSWWCEALRGMAHHAAGRYAASAAFYDRAYRRMTPAGRCIWEDFSPLYRQGENGRYLNMDCTQRRAMNRQFLWLADPFLGDTVNDLETEIRSRQVMNRLLENAATTYGAPFSHGEGDMILRYGWSIRFTKTGSGNRMQVQGYEPRPAYTVAPEEWWWEPNGPPPPLGPFWDLDAGRPHLRYAPTWIHRMVTPKETQAALFERGDSTLVAAVYPSPGPPWFGPGSLAVLAMARDPNTAPIVHRAPLRKGIARLIGAAPWRPLLVDVAVRDSLADALARDRYLVEPLRDKMGKLAFGMSDILFLEADTLPTRLEEAVDVALTTTRVPVGANIGIFWEMYGFGAGPVTMALLVVEAGKPVDSHLGAVREMPEGKTPLRIDWVDSRERWGDIEASSLGVNLSRLEKGRYQLVVEAKLSNGFTARTVRPFEIFEVKDQKE